MIKKSFERFHEDVYILKLKNGCQVHILPKEDPYYTTYVELSIPYGALHLNYQHEGKTFETPYGMAHFLEHQAFALPEGDAFTQFSILGTDANAMTSYAQTSYLFMATNHVFEALDHLLNMIDTPYFEEKRVLQEKSIIAEELKMYLDDPTSQMQNELLEQLYHNHPLRYDIGGTLESIQAITPELLKQTYDHFYNPSNRLIVIAGKVDIKALKAYFKAYDLKYPDKHQKPKILLPKEPKSVLVKHSEKVMDLSIDKLMIGLKLRPKRQTAALNVRRDLTLSMLFNMVLGSSSPMYNQLIEKGLINQSFYVQTTVEKQAENVMIYAESKSVKRLKNFLIKFLTKDLILQVNHEDFLRYKKVYLGQFIYALNHLDSKAYLYGKYFHANMNLFDVVDQLKEITFEDITSLILEMTPRGISSIIYKKA
ncbi:MAG: EF-P 5-aminopentanol modification-associated protein YfmH [Acholeplasmataceae bacterium]